MATDKTNSLKPDVLRVARMHFFYVAAYIVATIAFDSWNLITHDAVKQRWQLAMGLLVVSTLLWFTTRIRYHKTEMPYQVILLVFILIDIGFASMNVYDERGMASKAVALFVVPLIVAAFYRSRTALMTAATLCAAAYSLSTVSYFYNNYGEGFKVELYGGIVFYGALFFIVAWLLNILTHGDS